MDQQSSSSPYLAALIVAEWPADEEEALASTVSTQELVAYYKRKTSAILQRYGPGPRVHYHTGLVDEPKPFGSVSELRSQLVYAQEVMLRYSAEVWQINSIAFRDILDVGCGLGGGANILGSGVRRPSYGHHDSTLSCRTGREVCCSRQGRLSCASPPMRRPRHAGGGMLRRGPRDR